MHVFYHLSTVAGEDFNAAPVEVVIPASTMENRSVCVNISLMVIDDHIVESLETFTIELTGSTPPVEIGYPSSATVTIIDNDSEFKERILHCIICYVFMISSFRGDIWIGDV